MNINEKFVHAVREYVGVQWVETGRSKQLGVDCIGLVSCALRDIGFNPQDYTDYADFDQFVRLLKLLREQFDQLELSFEPPAGTVVLFRGKEMHNHVGVFTEKNTIIHAYSDPVYNKVIESKYDAYWMMNSHSMFWYKGFNK